MTMQGHTGLTATTIAVTSPFDGRLVGTVDQTPATAIDSLLQRAEAGRRAAQQLPRHRRAAILEGAATLVAQDQEAFARLISAEAGKTIRQARKEVLRCINTLRLSSEEAKRGGGEIIPFDAFAGSERRQGWFTREPLGIIVAITPFNDPLNLVAHKLGPAIAGGNAVLLKPSELAPLSALRLVEALRAAGLPEDVVVPVVGGADLGHALVAARAARMVSFTGGFRTGEAIAAAAGLKRLAMDLGGNAPVIVMADADLAVAVESCVSGAFWAAGQNCIGTQRILIERAVYDTFRDAFVAATAALVAGDPAQETTDVGPMITEQAALRAEATVAEAVAQGARVLAGHVRWGSVYHPTVLEAVPHAARLWSEEIFAPVVTLEPFDGFDAAMDMANAIEFSLHAGIFTRNLDLALEAASRIEAGGVMINDSSDYRFDAMPFGGFKYGSLGREGVRFAYEEMTQPKVTCINRGQA
ncbi:aldehyde dehydrogenase family protein [Gemmobacter fulvus]|uniref:Aldehyde dehydrogenase family protein n=1 Tax=Gemmobacter fulvus TaxID=2840474 RepID=A0A975P5U1_9RHOB|nr:aldehyde dehydrogenase family protein [Gemmobacter fulvus]MBT9245773.1 aldehyde dehydrogenase family protein [Gemmobacter fulvus]QWK89386.1 aldehyde dehydrogenase family protein [Gemmobacter fulvus]